MGFAHQAKPCYTEFVQTIDATAIAGQVKREFYVLIEQDEDGFFVGEVPHLRGCYAQGRTMDELLTNVREVIELCLEGLPESQRWPEFVGVQKGLGLIPGLLGQ
jgi:predicted RNase H-like HicB family nuclease